MIIWIKTNFSTVYHPKIDKQTKISNSIFEQYFRVYVDFFQKDWVIWLFSTEFVINNHVFEITRYIFLINSKQHFKMVFELRFFRQ